MHINVSNIDMILSVLVNLINDYDTFNNKWKIDTYFFPSTCSHDYHFQVYGVIHSLYRLVMEASHESLDTSKIWYYFNIIEVAFGFIFHVVYKKLALFLPICLQQDVKRKKKFTKQQKGSRHKMHMYPLCT